MSGTHPTPADRLRRGDALHFLFVKMPCPAEIESAGYAGFDAVIIDTEHGSADPAELEHHLRAADAAAIPALVRVRSGDRGEILGALDAGAIGVVVPHVTDPSGAHAAVASAHYPPRGMRGLALTTRAGRYGTAPIAEHLARAEAQTLVIVQIEDAEAVPRAPEILAVEGVDGVLIGATDLSISLGHPGAPEHPEVSGAIATITAAARAAGRPVARVVASPDEIARSLAEGATVAIYVATQLVRDAFRQAAGPLAGGPNPAPGPARRHEVVLLPGMLGTAELWDGVAPSLAEVARVRMGRIDLDGTVEEMAASVLAAAPDRFVLAGHSLGAIVALAAWRRAPERVASLALLNASARPPSEAQLAAWDAMEARVAELPFDAFAAEFARANLPEARHGEGVLAGRVAAMALGVGPRGLLRQLSAQRTRPDSRPVLGQVRCPTLVVSGAQDEICPPALQDELAAGIPGARLERIASCGHMSPLEAPAEVAGLLRELVSSPA